jgi:hypothetical protein
MRSHTKLEAKREFRGASKALCVSLENMVVESKFRTPENDIFSRSPQPRSWEDFTLSILSIRITGRLSRVNIAKFFWPFLAGQVYVPTT